MTDITNRSEEGRRQEILRYCSTPKTVEQVAKEFNIHIQTARKTIWVMRDDGRIKEIPMIRPKLWQASDHRSKYGEVMIPTSSGMIGLAAFQYGPSPYSTVDLFGASLAYLWRRSHYRTLNQDNIVNVANQGTLDPYLEVRRLVERMYARSLALTEAIDFVLTALPDMWRDGDVAVNALGRIDGRRQLELESAAEWFEEWARDQLRNDK